MYTKQPKKMLIMNILDILRKYTDENHKLSQAEILEKLKTEYNMEVNRKSIKPNIMNLIDFGYDINYSEKIRNNNEVMLSDFYINRDFTDEELRILIDSLLFSKYIPYNQCKELVNKLEGLSSIYFKYKIKHIRNLPEKMPKNNELFYNVAVIDEAISKNRQIMFTYRDYGTNKKLQTRKTVNNKNKKYVVNPYQMVATNGRYYLICNHNWYNNIGYYRIDRIADVELLDTPAKPIKEVKGCENGLNLPQLMAEHIYMFSGESATVIFKAKKYIITDIIDWFGTDVNFSDETCDEIRVSVFVNLNAMKFWAMQYANHIKVISPQSLVDEIKADLKSALEKYS
ncbi:MAG: helix-turn-helix transcriptional regulator [Lachnospirales bacterium]